AMARQEPEGAVRHLRCAMAADPLRESAHRALMQALAASGNYAAATQTYRDLRLLLHRELRVEPAAETSALYQRIRIEARERAHGQRERGREGERERQAGETGLPLSLSLPPSLPPSAHARIPHPLTRLVGRESEVEEIAATLSTSRLVTLTGAG